MQQLFDSYWYEFHEYQSAFEKFIELKSQNDEWVLRESTSHSTAGYWIEKHTEKESYDPRTCTKYSTIDEVIALRNKIEEEIKSKNR